jgi:hypothetical protein
MQTMRQTPAQLRATATGLFCLILAICAGVLAAPQEALAQAPPWVTPPHSSGYISGGPDGCALTHPFVDGCWLGPKINKAMDNACAINGDVRDTTQTPDIPTEPSPGYG